jgi:NAD(P)-dependent dehydrogenase (short-subunit alcohol dehydrogenase family)
VLVTGAGGGMGRKIAELLAENGYFVFALDRKKAEAGENIMPVEADVTDEESVRAAFCKVSEFTRELSAIVHFVGIYTLDSLMEMENESFERIFRVNTIGAHLVNRAFLPLLKSGSRIIITTSELAPLDPLPFTGIYAVTKSALD